MSAIKKFLTSSEVANMVGTLVNLVVITWMIRFAWNKVALSVFASGTISFSESVNIVVIFYSFALLVRLAIRDNKE